MWIARDIAKQITDNQDIIQIFHWRSKDGEEIDFLYSSHQNNLFF
ncbi:DUF4143 domain-containing protein [Leptospira meyeri]|nr:DUF4143 domain-containing protein [Leptospira meyeri]